MIEKKESEFSQCDGKRESFSFPLTLIHAFKIENTLIRNNFNSTVFFSNFLRASFGYTVEKLLFMW